MYPCSHHRDCRGLLIDQRLNGDGRHPGTLHIERTRQLTYDYPALYAAEKRRALKAELKRTAR